MRRRRVRFGASVTLTAVASLLVVSGPASAEEPVDDLVRYPPSHPEVRREAVGNAEWYVEEAGATRAEIIQEVSVIAGPVTRAVIVVRGTRFVSPAAAEAAGRALATRDLGTVRDLGSLGDGWIVTIASEHPAPSGTYVHDGFRVRGRDLFSFVGVTYGDAQVPAELLSHMAWHAETYPGGSDVPVPTRTGGRPARLGLLAVAVLLSGTVIAALLDRRRRRPIPPPLGPPVGPVDRPWVD